MKFVYTAKIEEPEVLVDVLARQTELSKSTIKDCLNKGAVWLKRPRRKEQRIRRSKCLLKQNDSIHLYYDSAILSQPVPEAECVADEKNYSIWNKPAGLLSQGTRYGDHCSLLRVVEKHFGKREVFLVHRLDREASGLVLIAHDRKTAAAFSMLFGNNREDSVEKWYQATVHGLVQDTGKQIRIDQPLDGKQSCSMVRVISADVERNRTLLEIRILTGRFHQIRRHLSSIDHPIVGDYRYGKRTGDKLQLQACRLSFKCPVSGRPRSYSLIPDNK